MVWMMLLAWVLAPSACHVHVDGMPVPQLRHHEVQVGSRRYPAKEFLEVDAKAGDVIVLRGARYRGVLVVGDTCEEPWVIQAQPLPAVVSFSGLPKDAVVSCESCGWPEGKAYLPAHAPNVVVNRWTTFVTFEFKAVGYESRRVRQVLRPGPNLVPAELRRRGP